MKNSTNNPMSRKKKIIVIIICVGIIIGDFLSIAFFSWAIQKVDELFERLLTIEFEMKVDNSAETEKREPVWTSSYEEEKEALDKITDKGK